MAIDKRLLVTFCAGLVVIALSGCGQERPAERSVEKNGNGAAPQVAKDVERVDVERVKEDVAKKVEGKGDLGAGKQTYAVFCASCHGNTGKGDGPAAAALPTKPRSLSDTNYMNTLTDQHLFKVIKEGGTSVGKSPLMPPWGGQLDDQQIWNVVVYVRKLSKSSN